MPISETKKPKILLIDDDENLRQMYTYMLTNAGFAVHTAPGGVEGLKLVRDGGYDLVLLDLVMPDLDGIQVLKRLKDEPPKTPNGPVIVLSNAGYETTAQEAKSLGAKDFLVKAELLPKDLVDRLKKFLDD